MKMKRSLCILLCVSLALALGACSAQPTPTATTAPTTAPTAQPSPTPQATEVPTPQPTESPTESPSEAPAGTMPDMANVPPASEAKDGTYTARMSEAYTQGEGHGWQTTLTVVFEGGAVKDADFDAFKDGERKSAQSPEAYPMDPPPSEWIAQLAKQIEAASAPADIDGVTGATIASGEARLLYAAVLKAASQGDTSEITVE